MIFLDTTNGINKGPLSRPAGWSESWYYPGQSITTAYQAATQPGPNGTALLVARAALMPVDASIVALRFQVVDPIGLTRVFLINLPGSYNFPGVTTCQPQQSLQGPILAAGGLKNRKILIIRGIPNNQIVDGEFVPGGIYGAALVTYVGTLATWTFRARDLGQTQNKILNISAAGLVTCVNNVGYTNPNMVRILRSKDVGGRLRGGLFQVATTPPPAGTTFTISNWPYGATTGGQVRLDLTVYPSVDPNTVPFWRASTRRTGRPFGLFRGRRPVKH